MSKVIIGSARGDERGKLSGGAAGDQKQKTKPDYAGEVSRQNWYLHSKGWVLARAKDSAARERIAQDMEYACDNPYIGYDQAQDTDLYKVSKPYGYDCSKVAVKTETDCAKLVRVCVLYAGIYVDNFYTGNEIEELEATRQFEIYTDAKHCRQSGYLMRGDILCTKEKGHTVVVLSDGAKIKAEAKGTVADYQRFLNNQYPAQVTAACGGLLAEDNVYGEKTRNASLSVWKLMANRYYGADLTVGNPNFLSGCKAAAARMSNSSVATHPTLIKILQGIMAGKGFYKAGLTSSLDEDTIEALKAFQGGNALIANGLLSSPVWAKLFS